MEKKLILNFSLNELHFLPCRQDKIFYKKEFDSTVWFCRPWQNQTTSFKALQITLL